ncbi:hypothetical protein ACFWOJ_09375 [Streptomyces sp. NPDC058439]|uniref:hypothetical protein n=1 Tax=Streptomyces sp. NPDC058439 TaxID=3346500 RepID=UPI003657D1D5
MGITVAVLWAGTPVTAILLLRARIADRAAARSIRSGVLPALVGAGFRQGRLEDRVLGGRHGEQAGEPVEYS